MNRPGADQAAQDSSTSYEKLTSADIPVPTAWLEHEAARALAENFQLQRSVEVLDRELFNVKAENRELRARMAYEFVCEQRREINRLREENRALRYQIGGGPR